MNSSRFSMGLAHAWLIGGVFPLIKSLLLSGNVERATGSRLLAIGFVLACLLLYAMPIGYLTRRADLLDQQR
ncbi:hypothetical protein KBB27_01070 [Patescibacteria group bacterium]|nr:hypothetical protein [Patescibacteria group bacterium]